MLTNLFIKLGWSRDDFKWLFLQIVAVAALISSNVFDVPYWADYLGVPLSPTALHWIFGISALVLWLSGRYNSSPLPSGQAMASGVVKGSSAERLPVLVLLVVLAGGSFGCATAGKVPPDVAVASYGTDVLKAATDFQRTVTQMTDSKLLPVATAQQITDQIAIIDQKAGPVSDALKAYHAATTPLEKQSKAALIQTLVTQLNGPLANILGIAVPSGTVSRITKLVGDVMAVISAIQMEVAKGLGSASTRGFTSAISGVQYAH